MKGNSLSSRLAAGLSLVAAASALTIAEINGDRFLSPYNGQTVTNVTGVVTAKGPSGIWVRQLEKSGDARVSDAVYVYGSALAKNASISAGDVIVLGGKVTEYRSSKDYLYLTEINTPAVSAILEHGVETEPLVLGVDTLSPPTVQYTSLDGGDVFGVPNNQSLVSVANPVLEPETYGLDFWESLVGQLVTVKSPRAVGRPNRYGDTWVVGAWNSTGDNQRGGLTLSSQDSNPEAILIGEPLDGTSNPTGTKLGDSLEDITGVVYQAFGFYRILPLTKLTVTESLTPALPDPISFTSDGVCSGLTVGAYNVENFAPSDTAHVQAVAAHIVDYLKSPDLVFVQEIQDNNGETNDGVVDSDVTLQTLVDAIASLGSVTYNFTYISPLDGADGGAPGGNIRVAYLFNPSILQLRSGVSQGAGNATTPNEVLPGPELKFNPGLVDPLNSAAWANSRKPLAAAWETLDGNTTFFTVNVHWGSKGGSSSIHGDARPPKNGGVDKRVLQAQATASFIAEILAADPEAYIISAGDFNEYSVTKPIVDFMAASGLEDMDVVAGVGAAERYTYMYDMNSQELDHMFVSPAVARQGVRFEHVHVNTWVAYDDQTSDHDPGVAKFDLCRY